MSQGNSLVQSENIQREEYSHMHSKLPNAPINFVICILHGSRELRRWIVGDDSGTCAADSRCPAVPAGAVGVCVEDLDTVLPVSATSVPVHRYSP